MAKDNGASPPSIMTEMETITQGGNVYHREVQYIHISEYEAKTCKIFWTYLTAVGKTSSKWLEVQLWNTII